MKKAPVATAWKRCPTASANANARMALVICPIRDRDPLRAEQPDFGRHFADRWDGGGSPGFWTSTRRQSDCGTYGEARAGHVNFS